MKVDRTSDLQLQSLKQRQQEQEVTSGKQSVQSSDQIDLPKPVRVGQSVVYVSLSKSLSLNGKAFDATGNSSSSSSALEGGVQPTEDNPLGFDYKAVAKSVLGFVTGYIRLAQADGGDDEKLKDLLSQARKGIDQGFGDARKELKGMNMLSDELDMGIEKGYDLIQDELHKFEDELFAEPTSSDESPQVDSTTELLGLASGQRSSLEVTTREGDKVTIALDQQESWRLQHDRYTASGKKAVAAYGEQSSVTKSDTANTQSRSSSSLYYSHTQAFSFSIEGDLNADELKSISSLIDQIGNLSDSFFSGDLDGALEQAQQLSLDDRQLVEMSLSLRQSQMASLSQVSDESQLASYSAEEPSNVEMAETQVDASSSPSAELFIPFSSYLQQLQAMMAQADSLFESSQQQELNSWVIGQQQGLQGHELEQANQQFSLFNHRMKQSLVGLTM